MELRLLRLRRSRKPLGCWMYVHANLVVLMLLFRTHAKLGRAKCSGHGQYREAGKCFSIDLDSLEQLLLHMIPCKKPISIRGKAGGLADVDGVSLILWSGEA